MTPAELLLQRFVLRDDVYPRQGRNGDYQPVRAPLTLAVLGEHLRGRQCIGVYQLRGSLVKWLCLDVDGAHKSAENAREATRALVTTCRHFNLVPCVERSGGKGWHVWIFTQPVEAALVQAVGYGIIAETGPEALAGCQGIEVFPKQTAVGDGEFGNLVKLPWGKRADNGKRGVFVDAYSLEPLSQADQLATLEAAVLYTADDLRALVEENGWEERPRRELPNGETAHPEKWGRHATFPGDLPCFEYVIDPDSPAVIGDGHRNNVLFAFTNQRKRSGCSQKAALRDILSLARERCRPAYPDDQARRTVESAYRSLESSAGCEIIQAAELCPVHLHGVTCPIFDKARARDTARREVLAADENALSITPLRVSRGEPPIYTATVRGREIRLSLGQLSNFRLFRERCIAGLDFVPELPFVPKEPGSKEPLPAGKVWDLIVGEALAGVIEEAAPPEDASPAGATWEAIREFIAGRGITEDRNGLLKGKPVSEDGFYLFRGRDLRSWLKLTNSDGLKEHELWMLVRDRGGDNGPVRTSRGLVRVWKVPTECIDIPQGDGEEPDCAGAAPSGLLE